MILPHLHLNARNAPVTLRHTRLDPLRHSRLNRESAPASSNQNSSSYAATPAHFTMLIQLTLSIIITHLHISSLSIIPLTIRSHYSSRGTNCTPLGIKFRITRTHFLNILLRVSTFSQYCHHIHKNTSTICR